MSVSGNVATAHRNCYISFMKTNQRSKPVKAPSGDELFANYINAKNALVAKLKMVIPILLECNALSVDPPESIDKIRNDVDKIACHQWMYSKGHKDIYCLHVHFHKYRQEKCIIKINLGFLGMTEDELSREFRKRMLADLRKKRKSIQDKKKFMVAPLDKELTKIDQKIEKLKNPDAKEDVVQ